MSTIHQIYCTHCTYGTSALEAAPAEMADTPLGYSARAGSLGGHELAEAYHQIDALLAYRLPPGLSEADKLRLTPQLAPRTFLFLPAAGRFEVFGQVCHRPTDSTGRRAGSYFGHLLFRPRTPGAGWTARECLKLYAAAGWVTSDDPDIPRLLPPLPAVNGLLAGRPAAVDESVLMSFLTAPAGGAFHDPNQVVPPHWRQRPPADRATLLADVLSGFLDGPTGPRRVTALAAEPGLAALLFFGVFRLVPPGPLTDAVSLSTYDCDPARRRTRLLATTFADPERGDLPADFYTGGADFALNTFTGRRSPAGRTGAAYARHVIDTLVEHGWDAVDALLASLARAGVSGADDLESAAAALRLLPNVLDPQTAVIDPVWRRSPTAGRVLAEATAAHVGGPHGGPWLAAAAGSLAHLRAIDVLAAGGAAVAPRALGTLLQRLPDDLAGEVVRVEGLSDDVKLDILTGYAARHGRLPEGGEAFWARPGGPDAPLARLVGRLDADTLERVGRTIRRRHLLPFLNQLHTSGRHDAAQRDVARKLYLETLHALNDDQLCTLLGSDEGATLLDLVPVNDVRLRGQLGRILDEVPRHLDRLDRVQVRLHALRAADAFLDDPSSLDAWEDCVAQLERLRQFRTDRSADRGHGGPRRAAVVALAERFDRAMPAARYGRDSDGTLRGESLRQLAEIVLREDRGVITRDAWEDMEHYFAGYSWPRRQPHRKPAGRTDSKRSLYVAGGVALVIFAAVVITAMRSGQSATPEPDVERPLVAKTQPRDRGAESGPTRPPSQPAPPTNATPDKGVQAKSNDQVNPPAPAQIVPPSPEKGGQPGDHRVEQGSHPNPPPTPADVRAKPPDPSVDDKLNLLALKLNTLVTGKGNIKLLEKELTEWKEDDLRTQAEKLIQLDEEPGGGMNEIRVILPVQREHADLLKAFHVKFVSQQRRLYRDGIEGLDGKGSLAAIDEGKDASLALIESEHAVTINPTLSNIQAKDVYGLCFEFPVDGKPPLWFQLPLPSAYTGRKKYTLRGKLPDLNPLAEYMSRWINAGTVRAQLSVRLDTVRSDCNRQIGDILDDGNELSRAIQSTIQAACNTINGIDLTPRHIDGDRAKNPGPGVWVLQDKLFGGVQLPQHLSIEYTIALYNAKGDDLNPQNRGYHSIGDPRPIRRENDVVSYGLRMRFSDGINVCETNWMKTTFPVYNTGGGSKTVNCHYIVLADGKARQQLMEKLRLWQDMVGRRKKLEDMIRRITSEPSSKPPSGVK